MNKAGSSTAFVAAKISVHDIDEYFDGMSIEDLMRATSTIQTVEELLGKAQPDLALVVAILVSTGWNLNDDIFTPAELWKARSSALHKPMNDNHDATKIMGHIVKSRALDKNGVEIELGDEDTPPFPQYTLLMLKLGAPTTISLETVVEVSPPNVPALVPGLSTILLAPVEPLPEFDPPM